MSRRILIAIVLVAPILVPASPCRADLDEQIDEAIRKGAAYLISRGRDDGSFEGGYADQVGQTAICLYALLSADIPLDHEVCQQSLERVLKWASRSTLTGDRFFTYNAGATLLALDAVRVKYSAGRGVGGVDLIRAIHRVAKALEGAQAKDGGYTYRPADGTLSDISNTQYAVLGYWVAERAGYKISPTRLKQVATYLENSQTKDNYYIYGGNQRPKVSYAMQAAGIGTMAIVHLLIHGESIVRDPDDGDESSRKGGLSEQGRSVEASFKYFEKYGYQDVGAYYLYALERACTLTETSTIRGEDWYKTLAKKLINIQATNGSWKSELGTAWTILFLTRATRAMYSVGDIELIDEALSKIEPDQFASAQPLHSIEPAPHQKGLFAYKYQGRDVLLYVPSTYSRGKPSPLFVDCLQFFDDRFTRQSNLAWFTQQWIDAAEKNRTIVAVSYLPVGRSRGRARAQKAVATLVDTNQDEKRQITGKIKTRRDLRQNSELVKQLNADAIAVEALIKQLGTSYTVNDRAVHLGGYRTSAPTVMMIAALKPLLFNKVVLRIPAGLSYLRAYTSDRAMRGRIKHVEEMHVLLSPAATDRERVDAASFYMASRKSVFGSAKWEMLPGTLLDNTGKHGFRWARHAVDRIAEIALIQADWTKQPTLTAQQISEYAPEVSSVKTLAKRTKSVPGTGHVRRPNGSKPKNGGTTKPRKPLITRKRFVLITGREVIGEQIGKDGDQYIIKTKAGRTIRIAMNDVVAIEDDE